MSWSYAGVREEGRRADTHLVFIGAEVALQLGLIAVCNDEVGCLVRWLGEEHLDKARLGKELSSLYSRLEFLFGAERGALTNGYTAVTMETLASRVQLLCWQHAAGRRLAQQRSDRNVAFASEGLTKATRRELTLNRQITTQTSTPSIRLTKNIHQAWGRLVWTMFYETFLQTNGSPGESEGRAGAW